MNELKSYGINDTLLTNIAHLAEFNPDQLSVTTAVKPGLFVSPALLRNSKFKDKLYKAFKKIGLYNIIYIRKNTSDYSFIANTPDNKYLSFDIAKSKDLNVKKACGLAILDFIYKINSPTFFNSTTEGNEMPITNDSTEKEELFIPGVGKLNINMPAGADENTRISLNDFISQLQSGKIKLNNEQMTQTMNRAEQSAEQSNVIDGSCTDITNENNT